MLLDSVRILSPIEMDEKRIENSLQKTNGKIKIMEK